MLKDEQAINKLLIRDDGVQIKVEVTPVVRGCVYEPEERAVADAVEEQFGFARIQVVSFADLYAASWWRPSTGSIRVICSMCVTCSPTKALRHVSATRSLCISSVPGDYSRIAGAQQS